MHIHFASDDEEERRQTNASASTSAAAAAAYIAPQQTKQHVGMFLSFQCVSSVRTDFDQQDQCYVLDLVHQPATGLVAAALSNKRVKLYKYSEGGLEFGGDLLGHSQRITDVRFDLPEEPHLLHTSSADGTVRGWDTRSGQQVEGFQAQGRELLSASTNGQLVAAGGGDSILFWDRRKARPLTSFGDTHAQDVAQVSFHPHHRSVLVSGSEDGLLAVFDTAAAGGLDEDEGFKAALNIDNSVARFGFYGSGGCKLWCRSGTETFHLWEWAAACSEEEAGGNGALADVANARQQLTQAATQAPAGAALAPGVDYIIGAEYSPAADQLWVVAGNNGGCVGFFPVVEPPSATGMSENVAAGGSTVPAPSIFAPPQALLSRGHDEVVRAVLWPGASGERCLSGGEDSRICAWALLSPAQQASMALQRAAGGSASSGSEGVARRQQLVHARRKSPY